MKTTNNITMAYIPDAFNEVFDVLWGILFKYFKRLNCTRNTQRAISIIRIWIFSELISTYLWLLLFECLDIRLYGCRLPTNSKDNNSNRLHIKICWIHFLISKHFPNWALSVESGKSIKQPTHMPNDDDVNSRIYTEWMSSEKKSRTR